MENHLDKIITSTKIENDIYHPSFYKLSDPVQKAHFFLLLKQKPYLQVHDELHGQLEELVKSVNPREIFKKEQLSEAAKEYLGKCIPEEYGVWVYYPWANRIVHTLDEKEFVIVRTNRNHYKITPEEKEILSAKKIGVMGLSVGQSISMTMAMERCFGELRLADFDILELSNLNRIRTGVHNLGIKKAIAVAREIAEIDPFLKITCFPEGITEENIDTFLTESGKLDILVDECDGLYIKILSRQRAKAFGIPVIMETSDKGMLDIERFDLEPNRPILHGLIDHLDITKVKQAQTNEEKIPYILPMIGLETLSPRLKASMMEVGESITTWPQLATSVALGGAIGADVSRRVLLDQFHDSGRYYIDIEDLIKDKNVEHTEKNSYILEEYDFPSLSFESMKSATSNLLPNVEYGQVNLSHDTVQQLVAAANTAPSGGNCQPWKWLWNTKSLFLFYDKSRNKSFLDFDDVSAYSSLGAAVENLVLKAHKLGMEVKIEQFPSENNVIVVAKIIFFEKGHTDKGLEFHIADDLVEMIEERYTNRNIRPKKPISKVVLDDIKAITETVNGARLQFVDTDKELAELRDIIAAADRIRLLHPQGHHDIFHNEVRWNHEEAIQKKDGVDIETIDATASEILGFKLAKDPIPISYLREWNKGGAFEKMPKKVVESASAVGLITMPHHNKRDYFNGGRAWQRMWLDATEKGIGVHPLLVPLMFFIRHEHGKGLNMPIEMNDELRKLRKKFTTIFQIEEGSGEVFLFRLCIAEKPKVKSLRRPIEDTICFEI